MRILIFTLQFPPSVGGVETMAYNLSKHFAEEGHEVIVLAGYEEGAPNFDAKQDFRVTRITVGATDSVIDRFRQKVHFTRELSLVIRNNKPDFVLCIHWDPCSYLARAVCATSYKLPYFLIAHGMELVQLPRFAPARQAKGKLRELGFKGARKIFAVSRFTRDKLLSLGVESSRVCIIPNGIELADDNITHNLEYQKTSQNIVLLSVSRLVERKGHDLVLKALPSVIQSFPHLTYYIAGIGPERERLECLSRSLGLESHVHFLGRVTEKEKETLFSECDVFVLPTRDTPNDFEGFGIAFLEAMKHAKPVIAARSGGVSEIVQDGETGFLVDSDNVPGLVSAIMRVLLNPKEARLLGENGFRSVNGRFRWEVIARQYLAAMIDSECEDRL